MKCLILNVDYPEYLKNLYENNVGLESKTYNEQMQARVQGMFGVSNYYSENLRLLGHEAWDIHVNNEAMQRAWAREHGFNAGEDLEWKFYLRRSFIPWASRFKSRHWFSKILSAQIKYYNVDVVLNQAMDNIPCSFFNEMKANIPLLIGQHAATPLSDKENWNVYDACISSFPPTVDWFRSIGLRAELNRLAFEMKVLKSLNPLNKCAPVSFVGSLQPIHDTRIKWLEYLCAASAIHVWTPDFDILPATSVVRRSCMGVVWGGAMYQVLRDSQITLNHHGNIPPYANNCRLFEATGVGTLLLTDWKKNLNEMFDVGREVVAYRSNEECLEQIIYYLAHPSEAAQIASAGQMRTLQDHTYAKRAKELIYFIEKCLKCA